MDIKINDIVRYIHEDNEEDKASGYYPPVGTEGKVLEISRNEILVEWNEGTLPGSWYTGVDTVEKVSYNWIPSGIFSDLAKCPHCGRTEFSLHCAADFSYCPFCGKKVEKF